jgi:hypothetical protein
VLAQCLKGEEEAEGSGEHSGGDGPMHCNWMLC